MGAMKDLDIRLDDLDSNLMIVLHGLETVQKNQTAMLHLLQDMVLLESKIESMEDEIQGTITKLLDRLIELSMVKQGEVQAANQYRAQTRVVSPSVEDALEEEAEEWPPKNCTVMDVRG